MTTGIAIRYVVFCLAIIGCVFWIDSFLPPAVFIVAALVFFVFAVLYTVFRLLGGRGRIGVGKLWKEFLDFLYGLG